MEQLTKFVVYTVITGNYDDVKELTFKRNENIKYICFTNNKNVKSNTWDVIFINEDLNDHMLNRKIKLFPHKYIENCDFSLYVDGNILIKNDLICFFEKYCNNELIMALPRHMDRECIYKEAEVCIFQKKDDPDKISAQMSRYRAEGFPNDFGLYENNIILRNHSSSMMYRIMISWWSELNNESKRDQLSLCYALWRMKVKIITLEESSRSKNPYFSIVLHKSYQEFGILRRFIVLVDMNKHKNLFYKSINIAFSFLRKLK